MTNDQVSVANNGAGSATRSRRPAARVREELGTRGRLLLGWGLVVASAVLLAVGWYGVSGTPFVARQLSYLVSGGIGGLLAGIVGVGLLVSGDVRRDRERFGRVEAELLELREMLVAQAAVLTRLGETSTGGAGARTARERGKTRS